MTSIKDYAMVFSMSLTLAGVWQVRRWRLGLLRGCKGRGSSGFEVPHKHPFPACDQCKCGRSLEQCHLLFRFSSFSAPHSKDMHSHQPWQECSHCCQQQWCCAMEELPSRKPRDLCWALQDLVQGPKYLPESPRVLPRLCWGLCWRPLLPSRGFLILKNLKIKSKSLLSKN